MGGLKCLSLKDNDMKKLCSTFMLLLFLGTVFGQTTALTKEDYLLKSKNQKTAGTVLLVGGTTMIIIGIIVGSNSDSSDNFGYDSNFAAGTGLLLGGLAADLISIPLFISSGNNARKAVTISFNPQRLSIPQYNSYGLTFQPTLTARIPLN
jgi:hypothetical protein